MDMLLHLIDHGLLWVVVAAAFLFGFRKPIASFVAHATEFKAGLGGISVSAPPPQPTDLPSTQKAEQAIAEVKTGASPQAGHEKPKLIEAADSPEIATLKRERDLAKVMSSLWETFTWIYASQFNALAHLNNVAMLPDAQLQPYYQQAKQKGLTVNYDQWLQYLLQRGLVQRIPPSNEVGITINGRIFINFCYKLNLPLYKLAF